MGAPSDNDRDRGGVPQREVPVDEAWSMGTTAHNDRTTAGLYVDPASVGRLIAGKPAPDPDHEQTIVGPGAEQLAEPEPSLAEPEPSLAEPEPSPASVLDQTLATFEPPSEIHHHDRTTAGLGVATSAPKPSLGVGTPRPVFALLQPGKGTVPLEKETALVQPERSPLDFVMRDMDPAAPARPHASGDSSRFVAAFIGGQPPAPRVEAESPVTTAMQPVLRRARLRRRWVTAGAIAAVALFGVVFAFAQSGGDETPRTTASEATEVAEPAVAAPAPVAPAPSNVATAAAPAQPEVAAPAPTVAAPADDTPAQPAPAAQVETVALAATTPTARQPVETPSTSAKPKTAKKTVATKDTTPAKSSTAKKATTAKSSTAKKAVATKSTTAKSSTTKKTATAKAPAKKTAAATKASTAKKSTAKPTSTTKAPAKKTPTKKSSRAKRSSPQTRRR